jgi:outer membrane receptor protein involved in Fe transport
MGFSRFLFLVAIALCASASVALGRQSGKIAGKVTDASTKEGLPGASVIIDGTSVGAATDVDGNYVILNVPPGLYSVTASLIGYKKTRVQNVRVSIDFTSTLNFALEEGSIELEPVLVQGERSPLIRKDLTNPVASISTETINNLPVTDLSQVIGLQAGITVADDGSIHIRGGYANEVAYTLNGVNINNPYGNTRSVGLATNAVQEVSVSSGTFSAEYGTALSGVINYVTKEGGRNLHGSVKVYSGDHISSHTDLFNNIGDVTPSNVYRFEGTLGGPIVGDKLSFYTSGVYDYFGGSLYGQRIYLPTDSYISREGFPSTDPRRGPSSAPYYIGPYSHPQTDSLGGPGGDGAIVPMNWNKSYNLQGNIAFQVSPEMRLKYEIVTDHYEAPDNSGNSSIFNTRYKPDGRTISKTTSMFHSLQWTHTAGSRAFYTLKLSYIEDKGTSNAFDQYNDPRYLPTFYLQTLGNTSFLTGGVDLSRFSRRTQTLGAKFDLVAQLYDVHELKFGLEVRKHNLSVESYTLQFQDPAHPQIDPSPTNFFTGEYNFQPFIPTVAGGYVNYTMHPLQGSAYLQDKIELFESIILNLGLRYDYFDPAALYNPMISQELSLQDTIFLNKNLQSAKPKNMFSPRISVSFPITDQGTIRFSYGHFTQIGSLSSLYRNPNFRAPLGTTPSFGNPNVNPQRSIQYELGLQQGFTQNLKMELTAYYKDVRDYIFFENIITARGDKQYSVLTNLSYANTRGFSVSLLKRRGIDGLFSASIDYTFQIAEVNRTQPTDDLFFNEEKGKLTETYLVPLSFDRSHSLTSTFSLGDPNDWMVSFIGYLRTGTPYTPSFPASVVPITFIQNSDRQPMQWNVDLKVEKFFKIGSLGFSVFALVNNLFDTENALYVYANSGSPLYNIEQTTNPYQFADLKNRINRGDVGLIPLSAIDNYYADPGNVSHPRLVRLGMSMYY